LWLEWSARGVVEEASVYAVARNVTDRVETTAMHHRLREENRRLSEMINATQDAIIGLDRNGIIRDWNAGAEAFFGYRASEILGHSVHMLIPEDRKFSENRRLASIRRGQSIPPFLGVRLCRDGQWIDVVVSLAPIQDEFGSIVGITMISKRIESKRSGHGSVVLPSSATDQLPS
jgi:PAS domain S-box-containing protein